MDWTPPFKPVLQAMGVDASIIMDFHGDGHPRDLTDLRLDELDAAEAGLRPRDLDRGRAVVLSLGILLGNLARSEGQMAGIGVMTSMSMAALGGCWWPVEITPDWMQSLQLWLPTGWIMDALHTLVSFGRGPSAALPHLLATSMGAEVASRRCPPMHTTPPEQAISAYTSSRREIS